MVLSSLLSSLLVFLSTSTTHLGRKPEPKLQSESECDYCSLGYSNTYCSYRWVELALVQNIKVLQSEYEIGPKVLLTQLKA